MPAEELMELTLEDLTKYVTPEESTELEGLVGRVPHLPKSKTMYSTYDVDAHTVELTESQRHDVLGGTARSSWAYGGVNISLLV